MMVVEAADNLRFAENGLAESELVHRLGELRKNDFVWNDPHNMKAAYYAGDDVFRIARETYAAFHGDNLLYQKLLYPSLAQMSAGVVAMALELLRAPSGAGGTITSGGTESIILAVKAARGWARSERPTKSVPEIVVGYTCHPAFNKAADLMGLKVVRLPPTSSFQVDVETMRKHITENTIMIVGSAPAYPVGCIDPITQLAELAQAYNLWLHVDACVGGFFLPFAREIEDIPAFDFSVKGVRSMSVDLHKYGYTSRGASLVLLSDKQHEQYHRFVVEDWPTGQFGTPTISGSRPGGAVASAWAVMNYMGRAGYRQRTQKIIEARRAIIGAVAQMDEVCLLGEPHAGIVGIGAAKGIDMRAVRQGLMDRGWRFASLAKPVVGINILLNYTHGEHVEAFITDLRNAIDDVKTGNSPKTFTEDYYGG
ncbi:aspartate aminotransferase family protein [Microvirga sp. VF16]|uniref:pyridoxal phosphate-dependent decarboxylase family protein n=1 Tax=Microvirga sp. VF16 TaxID=2807101 RepID=UPI00193D5D63|nr:aspartate aminotransferase family protein [Microvirga sp. VF16]QRM32879.1 aspartate aminotransferase family protein [Microvirga sp. VF16]